MNLNEVNAVLESRETNYGSFRGHAAAAQHLKSAIEQQLVTRQKILRPDMQEALDMICHKIARIINGNEHLHDSWLDIAGYAKLVADNIAEDEKRNAPR